MEIDFNKSLEKLQCQFLCCFPVNNIKFELPNAITWDQQEQLVNNTIAHSLNLKFPIKISYQINFIKRLLQILEKNCSEVHDAVYERYCNLQKQLPKDTTEKYAYKHYLLCKHDVHLTLKESKSFVAEGTTGLCSWQASFALSDFLLHNKEMVENKDVLELGAGTGLCGFILTQCCNTRKFLLTDGSFECTELMHKNISLNFPNARETSKGCFVLEHQNLSILQLDWKEIEVSGLINKIKPALILAADVIYDDTVFEDLVNAIDYVFKYMNNETKMLLSATVRNQFTLNKFLNLLDNMHFNVEEQIITTIEESYLYWDRSTPVRILLLTKNC
ncbi:protein-lysine N-methyltransferase EEF2KMT [Teleopsis dalmanni]|uniref:protein-lysine N-methyltransferase EEF2KMT n=1 Tax=Teleopsis dalmanni TaxID=139649 RepID=UPI0018CD7A24|nr:protein-lysine N-methyltransferase EEF2KMT [Teleopsis dalmanni]